jgi:GNAT superfamily N-acetyltransferase
VSIVVEIRPLTTADAQAFMALGRRTLADSPAACASSPEDDRASSLDFVLGMLESGGKPTVFGAFAPELIGTIGIYRGERRKTAHKAHLRGMFVAPEYRGRGVGRRLLTAASAHARTLPEITQAQISVSATVSEAKRLHESCGFRVWGEEPQALQVNGQFITQCHLTQPLEPQA